MHELESVMCSYKSSLERQKGSTVSRLHRQLDPFDSKLTK